LRAHAPIGYRSLAWSSSERSFNRVKQWRGLAARCDEHALIYRGTLVLVAIMLWFR
jgi:transposase